MEGFKDYIESMKTNKVEITEEKFAEVAAEVLTSEPFNSIVKDKPSMMFVFGMYTAKMNSRIFHSKDNKDDESEDEK